MRRKIIPYKKYLVPLAKKLRNSMTHSELLLWDQLKNKQILGYDFDRQKPIDKYIVDFYCKTLQLVIEVDGFTHDNELAISKDLLRQQELEKFGIHFLRFDDREVIWDINNVILEIEGRISELERGNK